MKSPFSLKRILQVRLRYIILITLLLAGTLFFVTLFGIQKGKSDMLRVMENEGTALLEGLVTASHNTLKANSLIEDLVEQRLEALSQVVEQGTGPKKIDSLFLKKIVEENELLGIVILDKKGETISTSGVGKEVIYPSSDSVTILALNSLLEGKVDKIFLESEQGEGTPELKYLFAIRQNKEVIVILTSASYLEKFRKEIGIGYLIQKISQERGIDYIVLQSPQGIILASRKVEKLLKIEEDPFLKEALLKGQADSRVTDFEGKEVLEVVKPFVSDEMPSGIFRLGLSLEEYRYISQNYQRQMIIFTLVLFFLSLLFIGIVIANQNYSLLDRSYKEMKTLTGNILEAINSAVVAVDGDNKVIIFNRAAEEVFSIHRDKAISQKYSDVFPQDDCLLDETTKKGRRIHQVERKYKTFSGEEKHLIIGTSSFLDEQGKSRGAVGVLHDITELKRFEEEAKKAERLSALGNLAAGVAHEIRNPLNAISIAAQRLKNEFSPTANQREYLSFTQTMLDEIKRLNQIINQFLSLAKTQKLNLVAVDLKELLEDILQLLRIEAEEKGVVLKQELTDLPKLEIDREEMKKAILNIILNAVQATRTGGEVRLSASQDRTSKEVIIEIKDTGEGISKENLSKLFQPYFSTKDKGAGLGLSIAYRIITDHKGKIDVESQEGMGTTFTIKLPYKG
ncbi:MAG TPA: ATP-binding protein [candidate division Zixibacteria bacterium]